MIPQPISEYIHRTLCGLELRTTVSLIDAACGPCVTPLARDLHLYAALNKMDNLGDSP